MKMYIDPSLSHEQRTLFTPLLLGRRIMVGYSLSSGKGTFSLTSS